MMDESDAQGGGEPAGAFVAFTNEERLAAGTLAEVALAVKRASERDGFDRLMVFNGTTGAVRDLDLRGTEDEIVRRYAPDDPPMAKRGRPKLGVVAREVTLLPRHWDWLASQPGGASVALRKLVEAARKGEDDRGLERVRTEAAYRFMSTMAGNLPGFEEASRALFAHDRDRLEACLQGWPPDIRAQTLRYLGG